MISISVRSKYGLSAVVALATSNSRSPMQSKQIADSCAIPQNYLEQLLLDLKRSGIVKSTRGCQGGYVLAKSPENLRVLDILNCLEGPSELCSGSCPSLSDFWKTAESDIYRLFEVTIAQLVSDIEKKNQSYTYSI